MLGTRGVPASYGGFETAVEEIGVRLVERGHEVIVYCRGPRSRSTYRGMSLVTLPALRRRALETLSHTALSAAHAAAFSNLDVALVFNAANAPFASVLRAAGVPVAVHVDGLEWKRGKWQGAGKSYYLGAEAVSVALADAVIADAAEICSYYKAKFDINCRTIPYGATLQSGGDGSRLAELGLQEHGYHLVVARLEPENNVDLIVEGYRSSGSTLPLVVVGGNPYETAYTQRLQAQLAADPRILAPGGIYDEGLLNTLYAKARTYIHGHTVGGTNPSLLRAMGAGTAVIAHDNRFNREVLSSTGMFFANAQDVAAAIETAEMDPSIPRALGKAARLRAATCYRWEDVASQYEDLCSDLAAGRLARPRRNSRLGLVQALRRAPRILEEWPTATPGPRPALSLVEPAAPLTLHLDGHPEAAAVGS